MLLKFSKILHICINHNTNIIVHIHIIIGLFICDLNVWWRGSENALAFRNKTSFQHLDMTNFYNNILKKKYLTSNFEHNSVYYTTN